jgi:thiol-disulfide isomerase/thioredoxin
MDRISFFGLWILLVLSTSVFAQNQKQSDIVMYSSFDSIAPFFIPNNKIRVINFWATWCGPCVAEMPYIEGLHDFYSDDELEVVLVSLDFERDKEKRVIPYLQKNEIRSEVVMLLDDRMHIWVDQVDPNWSGSIPLTCIVGKDGYECYEKEFHSTEELISLIKQKQ